MRRLLLLRRFRIQVKGGQGLFNFYHLKLDGVSTMLLLVHIFVVAILLHRYAGGEVTEETVAAAVVEFTAAELEANLKEWENDLAVMFYAPWCSYCKQLLPTWGTIASLKKENKDILVGKFDCEASTDHTDICQELGVDRYPSVYFIGYGNFNQADKGKLFGTVKNQRVVRYVADLYPTAINDWVSTMTSLSTLHRKWEDFVGMFTGNTRDAKRVRRLKERVAAAEKKTALVSKELERYKANEIFDELEDHGDPFVLLHSLPPDEQNLPLRVCVGEMVEEYCRFSPAEKYCKIALECANQDLAPERCRPAECPFESVRGCKVVSTCMQTDVIRQYQDALAKTAAKRI